MNPETLTYCKAQLRIKSKRLKRKSLKSVAISKTGIIKTVQTATHYCKEIRLQAKVFKKNINQINKYDYDQGRKD